MSTELCYLCSSWKEGKASARLSIKTYVSLDYRSHIFLVVGGSVYSNAETSISPKGFAEKLGRPITLGVFGASQGLLEEIDRIDGSNMILGVSDDWKRNEGAQVQVYFLQDWSDVSNLNAFAQEVFQSAGGPPDSPFWRLDFSNSLGREFQFRFLNLNFFSGGTHGETEQSCYFGYIILRDIYGGAYSDWNAEAENCLNQKWVTLKRGEL